MTNQSFLSLDPTQQSERQGWAIKRIKWLTDFLNQACHDYYVLAQPKLSDSEYDLLFRELKGLEERFPDLMRLNSPTQGIGAPPAPNLGHIKHLSKMISLANVSKEPDFVAFYERTLSLIGGERDLILNSQPKIDGVAVALIYENGRLKSASLRGDGQIGEDITQKVIGIRKIPQFLKGDCSSTFEVYGEIYMGKNNFKKLLQVSPDQEFKNSRNATAGTLRLQSFSKERIELLEFYLHSFDDSCQIFGKTITEVLEKLDSFGLTVVPWKTHSTLKSAIQYYQESDRDRSKLDYEIDGVVFKVEELSCQNLLGSTARAPRWAMAYKFLAPRATVSLKRVDFQVGRSGIVVPVAAFDPVELRGITISKATLHNFAEIKEKKLTLGALVYLERAGEVIPKIIGRAENQNQDSHLSEREIPIPRSCPSCEAPLSISENLRTIRCLAAFSCPAQLERRVLHFVSRHGCDIQGIGPDLIRGLIKKGYLKSMDDLFKVTNQQLASMANFQAKRIQNILSKLENFKSVRFDRFLYSLSIPGIGRELSRTLAEKFRNFDGILKASKEEIAQIPGCQERLAENIQNFLSSSQNLEVINSLLEKFIITELPD